MIIVKKRKIVVDDQELFNRLIGEAIRKSRKNLNKTLDQVASDTQLDDKHIGRLERAEKSPSLYTFFKLYRELDFSADEIFQEIMKQIESSQRDS
nr:helix-turn-helix transcriptional regulator [Ornithinibacillus caprae]